MHFFKSMRCKKAQKPIKSRCKFCTHFSRMLHAVTRMLCIFFAHVVRILRACCAYSSRMLRMRYASHALCIILAYDMRILRIYYASSLRMICVFFAYVTHHLCVWYAYSSCILHVTSRMLRVFFALVTPILRRCPRRACSPIPSNFSKECFYDALLKC